MTVHMGIATIAWVLLAAGAVTWKRRPLHARLVMAGMLVDVGLVLHLQFTRDAIQQAMRFDRAPLEQAHIAVSTLALVLYFPALYLLVRARRRPDDDIAWRTYGRVFGTALALRTAGFLLMFSMVGA